MKVNGVTKREQVLRIFSVCNRNRVSLWHDYLPQVLRYHESKEDVKIGNVLVLYVAYFLKAQEKWQV